MNRKPIFDAVRIVLGRGFSQSEVDLIDRAIERATRGEPPAAPIAAGLLGALSARFESGGRGPGAVSSGKHDPGGVSYGIYQLSSRAGTAAAFVKAEGARWQDRFGAAAPGTAAFGTAWKAIAAREPEAFASAQHAFIERTHYRPAVAAVAARTGLDLDARHQAVRDAVWSTAVQHGAAAKLLAAAVGRADAQAARDNPDYDRLLLTAIYSERTQYVIGIARTGGPATARVMRSVAEDRYPAELNFALAMLVEPQPV